MLRPRLNLATCVVEDEVIILDRAEGQVHHLNLSASRIWAACDGDRTLEQITALVADEFERPLGSIRDDVASTLDTLQRLGLLVDDEPKAH